MINLLRSLFDKNFRKSKISRYSIQLINKHYTVEIKLEEIYENIFGEKNDLAA